MQFIVYIHFFLFINSYFILFYYFLRSKLDSVESFFSTLTAILSDTLASYRIRSYHSELESIVSSSKSFAEGIYRLEEKIYLNFFIFLYHII